MHVRIRKRHSPMGGVQLTDKIVTLDQYGKVVTIEPVVTRKGGIISAVAIPIGKTKRGK